MREEDLKQTKKDDRQPDVPFLAAPRILDEEEIKTWRHRKKDEKDE